MIFELFQKDGVYFVTSIVISKFKALYLTPEEEVVGAKLSHPFVFTVFVFSDWFFILNFFAFQPILLQLLRDLYPF